MPRRPTAGRVPPPREPCCACGQQGLRAVAASGPSPSAATGARAPWPSPRSARSSATTHGLARGLSAPLARRLPVLRAPVPHHRARSGAFARGDARERPLRPLLDRAHGGRPGPRASAATRAWPRAAPAARTTTTGRCGSPRPPPWPPRARRRRPDRTRSRRASPPPRGSAKTSRAGPGSSAWCGAHPPAWSLALARPGRAARGRRTPRAWARDPGAAPRAEHAPRSAGGGPPLRRRRRRTTTTSPSRSRPATATRTCGCCTRSWSWPSSCGSPSGGRVLDLGGGAAWVSELLAKFGYRPVTLDIAPPCCAWAATVSPAST